MRACGIIPARLESSRLPGKMLLSDTGRPLIWYAWQAACQADELVEVIIATDSPLIAEVAAGFGAQVAMTGQHTCGTDRIAEVVRRKSPEFEIVVNIQGDEPEIDPASINLVVSTLRDHPEVEMSTLATPIQSQQVLEDPGCVKVVRSASGRALYFSRLPIPYSRDLPPEVVLQSMTEDAPSYQESPWLLHLGLYAYRREFLLALAQMPAARLERLESLEQLRALESGAAIQVEVVHDRSIGIDTPDDYARFVERRRQRDHH